MPYADTTVSEGYVSTCAHRHRMKPESLTLIVTLLSAPDDGNGPSAVELKDSKGFPITPYDFTGADKFKCGETNQDMFRVLVTGLDGTPMPSFSESMDTNKLWDVVHYLQTFRSKSAKRTQATKGGGGSGK